jgi:hypothetical protein
MVLISVSSPLCDGKMSAGAYSSEDAPVIWGQIADILDVQLHTGGVSGVSVVVVVVFARVRTGRLGILEGSRKSELAPLVIGGRELGMAGREVQVQSCLHLQQLTHYASALHPPLPHTSGGLPPVLLLVQGVFVIPCIDTVIPRRHTYPLRRLP